MQTSMKKSTVRLITWFKSLLANGIEIILTMLLVLAFFSVFLGLLNILFPSGTSLTELMNRAERYARRVPGETDLTEGLRPEGAGGPTVKTAAVLTTINNTVKNKRIDAIAWEPAREGMPLYDQDAVQTMQHSSAILNFDERSYLQMEANSLVIIKSLEQEISSRRKRSFLLMVDGELRGKLAGSAEGPVRMEIMTPSAVTRIETRNRPEDKADFKISINPDESSTIAVFEGVAKVIAQGKEVRVEANTAVTVSQDAAPSLPTPLPPSVEPLSPADAAQFYYRDLSPAILFTWKAVPQATSYHFLLARDPLFQNIVVDERLPQAKFSHGSLKQGAYFWRVSALKDTLESSVYASRRFDIVQKRNPPALSVTFPPMTVNQQQWVLTGTAEPGARVFVSGNQVQTDEAGEFKHPIHLERGINIIIVEAVDPAKNVTYRSQMVQGKF